WDPGPVATLLASWSAIRFGTFRPMSSGGALPVPGGQTAVRSFHLEPILGVWGSSEPLQRLAHAVHAEVSILARHLQRRVPEHLLHQDRVDARRPGRGSSQRVGSAAGEGREGVVEGVELVGGHPGEAAEGGGLGGEDVEAQHRETSPVANLHTAPPDVHCATTLTAFWLAQNSWSKDRGPPVDSPPRGRTRFAPL